MFLKFTDYYREEKFYVRQKFIVAVKPVMHKTINGNYKVEKNACEIETTKSDYIVKGNVDDIIEMIDDKGLE